MFFHLNKGKFNDYLALLFVLVSSLILLPDSLRFAVMAMVFFLSFFIFISSLSFQPRINLGVFLLGFFILAGLMHSFLFPPLTKYAEDKRIYFYFVLSLILFLTSHSNFYYKNYKVIFRGLFLVGIVYFFISIGFKPSDDNARVNEFGLNPLILAKNVALLGVLSLFIPNKKVSYIIFILSLVGVISTGSRGPFIILIFILFIKFIMEKEYFSSFLFITILSFILAFYELFLKFMPESFSSRLTGDALRYQIESDSGGERIHLFKLAIDILKDNPIWGVGLGNYSYYAPLNAPHNIYLEIFVEMGLFFFLMFLFFIFKALCCGYFFVRKSNDYELKGLFFIYLFFVLSMLLDGELTIQSFLLYYLGFLFLNFYYRGKRLC